MDAKTNLNKAAESVVIGEAGISSAIQVRIQGGVAIVALSVPQKRNALNREGRFELLDTINRLMNASPDVNAIVLTGSGGHFCAGADVGQMARPSLLNTRESIDCMGDIAAALSGGAKPVVAAVQGVAYGIGLSFSAACDVIVSAKNARYCAAFIKIGLLPDGGLMWTLPSKVGYAKARRIMSLAEEFSGEQAGEMGFSNYVVDHDDVLETAVNVAEQFTKMPILGLSYLKNSLTHRNSSLEDSLRSELDHQVVLRGTADHQEAARAFMEKRPPVFTGE